MPGALAVDGTEDVPPAVRCRGVEKAFGAGAARTSALRGVDLDVRRGELLLLVGPSGSGKTTLLSIIAAILEPDTGTCEVLGQDLAGMNERARALFRRWAIGFVFQSFNLLPALTAEENVALPLLIGGKPRGGALARARDALDQVGLGGRSSALPPELSGGQQQRVAIARALVHDPKLVLCDEPTSSLDHASGLTVMELVRNVVRTGERAVVVVTHDPRIFSFGDRIVRMNDGVIVGAGEPDVTGEGH